MVSDVPMLSGCIVFRQLTCQDVSYLGSGFDDTWWDQVKGGSVISRGVVIGEPT